MISLTCNEQSQYNSLITTVATVPIGTIFYIRDLIFSQPCSARVGRAFFEEVTSRKYGVVVDKINGAGAVRYRKI